MPTHDARTDVTDDQLIAALKRAVDAEERDLANGGVTCAQVATHCELVQSTVQQRLRQLVAEGRVRKVRGLRPDTNVPRWTYLPATGGDDGRGQ